MSTGELESVEAFGQRAAGWIEANLPPREAPPVEAVELQRLLFDSGFAGIAFPTEYGGAGLTLDHHKAFYDVASELGRQIPFDSNLMVSVGMLGPTILEHGSHEARLRFLPPLLRGDELWMQLLSEPQGGSDMAGSIARLTCEGDSFALSGEKVWSSGAHLCDYGLCLCRSDWDRPKHRGLSMIAVPLEDTPGVTIERIRAADGTLGEFCQEYFDDVKLPAENLIGEVNDGWAVAKALLFHERNAVANIGYGYFGPHEAAADEHESASRVPGMIRAVRGRAGVGSEMRQLIAEVHIEETVLPLTSDRVMTGMRLGTHEGQWGSLLKLQGSVAGIDCARTELAATGAAGVIWEGDEIRLDNPGTRWLGARGNTLAGGSSEMQRNIISERLLGLPREPSSERGMPFNEVVRQQRTFK